MRGGGVDRLGGGFGVLVGLALALGVVLYVNGKAGRDLSLHAFDGRGAPVAEVKVVGFVHSIDAGRRTLTVREDVGGAPRYRTFLLTPETRFLLVTRARGLEALDHPDGERRIGADEVVTGDYVVVSAAPVAEGQRAAAVTVAHSGRG